MREPTAPPPPTSAMLFTPLRTSAAVFGAINGLGFVYSAATGSHYHLDLLGTGAFTVAAMACGVRARHLSHARQPPWVWLPTSGL